MEMNTRLQVEHPVTEAITGEDLVSWQFKIAAGEPLPLSQDAIAQRISERGWAIEARIYAENPKQNFMPDSGKLIHLRTPKISEGVRIDAGFVQGDTISSAYDGMIAKLIVSGPTREVTLRKLHAALQDYEVVGLSTNIEFLKRICQSPAFIKGDVETGYIEKHYEELFSVEAPEPEVFVQAALGLLGNDEAMNDALMYPGPHGEAPDFTSGIRRQFHFRQAIADGESDSVLVSINHKGRELFDVAVTGKGLEKTYNNIVCDVHESSITTFFPHSRIETTFITNADEITLFQRGKQTQLRIATPTWYQKALGIKDVASSVLAPMPCKVLRNEVKEGDKVKKDQALVV